MKKTLLIAVIAVSLFSSCKREHTGSTDPSGKRYRVNFNITNFTSKQSAFAVKHKMGPSGANVQAPSYIADVLHYLVYDNQDNFLKEVVQDSSMSDFGIITDSLPAGTYNISLVAGKKGIVTRPGLLGNNDYSYGGNSWQDTFFGSFTLTVGTGNLNADLTLSRVVGKLEVTITDNIPANADSLIIATNQEAYGQDLFQGFFTFDPFITVRFAVAIPDSAKGKPNFTIDRLIGNCTSQFPLEIICKAADNSNIASTTVQNVNILANQKTIVSGDLFASLAGHNSKQQFTTKIDTAWGTATTQSSFSLRTQKPGNH